MYFIRIAMSESDVKAYVFENLVCQGSPKDPHRGDGKKRAAEGDQKTAGR